MADAVTIAITDADEPINIPRELLNDGNMAYASMKSSPPAIPP